MGYEDSKWLNEDWLVYMLVIGRLPKVEYQEV